MTQMVTRCPKCSTAFRITSTQIDSAKGSVRCGSCLHIFKAREHLVKNATAQINKAEEAKAAGSPAKTAKPADATKASTTAKPATTSKSAAGKPAAKSLIDKSKILADEDDVLISDDMDKATEKKSAYEFEGFIDLDLHPKQSMSLFEREIRYEEEKEDKEIADESWAEGLLADEGESPQQIKKQTPTQAPVKAAAPPAAHKEKAPIENKEKAAAAPEKAEQYSGPVFSLVSEPHHEEELFSEEFLNATRGNDKQHTKTAAESNAFAASLFDLNTNEIEVPKKTSLAVSAK